MIKFLGIYWSVVSWHWGQIGNSGNVLLSEWCLIAQNGASRAFPKFRACQLSTWSSFTHLSKTHVRVKCGKFRFESIFTYRIIVRLFACLQQAFHTCTTSWAARLIQFSLFHNNLHDWLWENVFSTTFLVPLLQLGCACQLWIFIFLFT